MGGGRRIYTYIYMYKEWDWTRLTKSIQNISSEELVLLLLHSYSLYIYIYVYILPLPPSGGMIDHYLLQSLLRPLKICKRFVAVLKKSKKTSSENTTFAKSE